MNTFYNSNIASIAIALSFDEIPSQAQQIINDFKGIKYLYQEVLAIKDIDSDDWIITINSEEITKVNKISDIFEKVCFF